jgi:PAS domain S-box-containing protein
VNKSGLANFGVSDINELKGFSFFNDPMFPEEMKKKLRKGASVRYETAFDFDEARKLGLFKTEKTGTIFLDMLFTPINTKKNRPISGYLAQVQDITERKKIEENMKMSEERYRTLFNSVNDAVFLHGISENGRPGKFIAVNDIACDIYGYSKEEFADMSPTDINDPERAADPVPVVKSLLKEKHVTFETVDMTKDGKSVPVEISARLFESNGKPMIISAVRDITERKKAEEAIKESEERYRNMFDSSTDGIFILDLKGNIVDANAIAYERLGYTKDEMLSMHIKNLDPPEHAAKVPERMAKIHEKGSAVFESAQIRKDGTVMPVEVNATLLEYEGKQVFYSVVRDITERKETERQLRESEARFRGAFENIGVGASMASLKGQFIKVNRSLCDMLGYTDEELLSKTFSDVTHPDDVQIGLDAAKKLVAGELTHTAFEKRYVRKNGQLINVVISPAIVRDNDGNPLHFMALFQDVTARKTAEEEIKRSLAEKEVLLKEIHHRVKNNMAIISSLLQLQARYSRDEKLMPLFKDSQNRISSMALVHEKLYQTQDFTNISFREYVEELVRHLMHTYGKKDGDISLVISLDDIKLNIDTIIPCGLILNELVTNSLKYAFEDVERPEIGISLDIHDDGQGVLVYSDNGRGMPERVNFPNSDTLGLQIVNMLALQLKGTVGLERNGGTKFVIKFDLPKDERG